jgi:hypothetical protein
MARTHGTDDGATAVTIDEMERELAFEDWLQSIPTRALKCRVQGHRLPDWDDRRHVIIHRYGGITYIESECLRHCGTEVTTFTDDDGFLTRSRKVHYYDPKYHYLMPAEARGRLTKARRAKLRKEFLARNADWITQDPDPEETA